MKTKCLIVDDEPLAIEVIESYLEKLEQFEIVAVCEDAVEASAILHSNQIDLLFLDIQMPKITGIDFLRTLRNPPKVIFTTAHREYALEGYELDIIDYLLKPIPFDRFLKAVNKYLEQSQLNEEINIVETETPKPTGYILVKGNRRVHKINLNDIVVIESIKDYVQIQTPARNIVVKQQISELAERLPEASFIRIHRSYIVALEHIECFTATMVELAGRELPIGRNYKNSTLQALKYNGIT